jgi:hypothetical protein
MRRYSVALVLIAWLAAIVGLAVLNAVTPLARAEQPAAPVVERPQQQNTGEWMISEMVFESNYPDGFTFQVKASSAGGEIAQARLNWGSASQREHQTRTIFGIEPELDETTGIYTASWEPTESLMLPPWSVLQYTWEFRDAEGNQFTTEPETVEYTDKTHDWDRQESDAGIVFSLDVPSDTNAMVIDALNIQQSLYEEVWGGLLPYLPRIVLFGDYDTWLEWRTDTDTSESSDIVGQTFDQWGVIVQVLYGFDMELAAHDLAYSTVTHETEHLYQAEFLANRRLYDVPGWFYEGDASFFEVEPSYDYVQAVRDMAANGDLPPLLVGVSDGPRIDGENPREGYDIGYSFLVWLHEIAGGPSYHAQIMQLLGQNVPFITALETATGISSDEIEREWRLWLGASEAAPTLIPTWTPFFPVIATPSH